MGKLKGQEEVNMMEVPSYTGLSEYNRNIPANAQSVDYKREPKNPSPPG